MKSVFIYPYRVGSASAAGLANALDVKRIAHTNSRYRGRPSKKVVNWGATTMPEEVLQSGVVLNRPELVRNASNKRVFFETVSAAGEDGPRVPDWTTSAATAAGWLANRECKIVFARTVIAGHSGEGIVEYTDAEVLAQQPDNVLYVKYVPKREEYRVHVSRVSGVFSVQRKARRLSDQEPNYRIRNHANGFVYAREGVELPNEDATQQALKALAVTGLDFGAIDLIYNARRGVSYVLEVNSAPGLEGSTVLEYAEEIRRLLNDARATS
jgi:glutathione synthase/RimK-type ligase-like ATP-grasp enzyme